MSYEGYEQYLCANGHLRVYDCWDIPPYEGVENPDEVINCNCGAPLVFHHSVNTTNGEEEGCPDTLPYPFEINTPAVTCTCSCGDVHVVGEVTYKIPEKFCDRCGAKLDDSGKCLNITG